MNRWLLLATAFAICQPCSAQLKGSQITNGVCGVTVYGMFGPKSRGTGFWISKDRVVTAKHMTNGRLTVKTGGGLELPAKVVKSGSGFEDWAVLRVQGGGHEIDLWTAKGAASGTGVWCYGDFRTCGGTIEVLRGSVTGSNYCSAPVYPGFSGGPVVNSAGRVVGVVSMSCGGGCIFVPIGKVLR